MPFSEPPSLHARLTKGCLTKGLARAVRLAQRTVTKGLAAQCVRSYRARAPAASHHRVARHHAPGRRRRQGVLSIISTMLLRAGEEEKKHRESMMHNDSHPCQGVDPGSSQGDSHTSQDLPANAGAVTVTVHNVINPGVISSCMYDIVHAIDLLRLQHAPP